MGIALAAYLLRRDLARQAGADMLGASSVRLLGQPVAASAMPSRIDGTSRIDMPSAEQVLQDPLDARRWRPWPG